MMLPIIGFAEGVTYTPIAITGEQVPGVEPGVVFNEFGLPVINDAGQVVFFAGLDGADVNESNDRAVLSQSSGPLRVVAREGAAVPSDGPENTFVQFVENTPAALNAWGEISFSALLMGQVLPGDDDKGIFYESGGVLKTLTRDGYTVPGSDEDGRIFWDFYSPTFNSLGQSALVGFMTDSRGNWSPDHGLFTGSTGRMRVVARQGESAPDTDNTFSDFRDVTLNNEGQTAFLGDFHGGDPCCFNNVGVFTESNGLVELVVKAGDQAPVSGEMHYTNIFRLRQNDAGLLSFIGELSGRIPNSLDNQGIFVGAKGKFAPLVRSGDAAPVNGDVVFNSFFWNDLNGDGHVAFTGRLWGEGVDNTNSIGIFTADDEQVALISRIGDSVPGSAGGEIIKHFINAPMLNNKGQVAFLAATIDGSGTGEGIFATDPVGTLRKIVRTGDVIDVDPRPLNDDHRTVANLGLYSQNLQGVRSSFNHSGQLVFHIDFTDGSQGIFVAGLPIPEPTSVALICLCGGGLVNFHLREFRRA